MNNDRKFFNLTQTKQMNVQKQEVDALEIESSLDPTYMKRLGVQTSKHRHQLLLESQGRENLKNIKHKMRNVNSELFDITTKNENEKR